MKTVIILTQPRSGSSLLAGILHHLGVYMGEEEELKRDRYLLKNAQKLTQLAEACEQVLYSDGDSIMERLSKVEKNVEALIELDPSLSHLKEAVSSSTTQEIFG